MNNMQIKAAAFKEYEESRVHLLTGVLFDQWLWFQKQAGRFWGA